MKCMVHTRQSLNCFTTKINHWMTFKKQSNEWSWKDSWSWFITYASYAISSQFFVDLFFERVVQSYGLQLCGLWFWTQSTRKWTGVCSSEIRTFRFNSKCVARLYCHVWVVTLPTAQNAVHAVVIGQFHAIMSKYDWSCGQKIVWCRHRVTRKETCNYLENIPRQNIYSAVRSNCKNLTSKEQLNAPSTWTPGPEWSSAIRRLVKDDMTPLRQRWLRGVMDLVAPASSRSHIAACQPACQEPHCGIN